MNPSISIMVNNSLVLALLDTGASVSLIREELVTPQLRYMGSFKKGVFDATGNLLPVIGELKVRLVTPEGVIYDRIIVFKNVQEIKFDVLIGMNILGRSRMDFEGKQVAFERTDQVDKGDEGHVELRIMSGRIIDKPGRYITRGIYVQLEN